MSEHVDKKLRKRVVKSSKRLQLLQYNKTNDSDNSDIAECPQVLKKPKTKKKIACKMAGKKFSKTVTLKACETSDFKYKQDQLVFAKLRGHIPWPARILKRYPKGNTKKYEVFFFQSNQLGYVAEACIWEFYQCRDAHIKRYAKTEKFQIAVRELEEYANTYLTEPDLLTKLSLDPEKIKDLFHNITKDKSQEEKVLLINNGSRQLFDRHHGPRIRLHQVQLDNI